MSRSGRKHSIASVTAAASGKQDKRHANRAMRKGTHQKLDAMSDNTVLPVMREVSDGWNTAKEGKRTSIPPGIPSGCGSSVGKISAFGSDARRHLLLDFCRAGARRRAVSRRTRQSQRHADKRRPYSLETAGWWYDSGGSRVAVTRLVRGGTAHT